MKEGKREIVIEEWYHVYLLLYSFYQCLEKHFGSEFFTELREAERKLLECSKALPDTIEIEPIRIDTGTVKGGEVASFIDSWRKRRISYIYIHNYIYNYKLEKSVA